MRSVNSNNWQEESLAKFDFRRSKEVPLTGGLANGGAAEESIHIANGTAKYLLDAC